MRYFANGKGLLSYVYYDFCEVDLELSFDAELHSLCDDEVEVSIFVEE